MGTFPSCTLSQFFLFSFLGPRSTLPGTKDQKKVQKSGLEPSEFALIILNINLRPPTNGGARNLGQGGQD